LDTLKKSFLQKNKGRFGFERYEFIIEFFEVKENLSKKLVKSRNFDLYYFEEKNQIELKRTLLFCYFSI